MNEKSNIPFIIDNFSMKMQFLHQSIGDGMKYVCRITAVVQYLLQEMYHIGLTFFRGK